VAGTLAPLPRFSPSPRPVPPPGCRLRRLHPGCETERRRPKVPAPVGSQIPIPSERKPSSLLGKVETIFIEKSAPRGSECIGRYAARTDNVPPALACR